LDAYRCNEINYITKMKRKKCKEKDCPTFIAWHSKKEEEYYSFPSTSNNIRWRKSHPSLAKDDYKKNEENNTPFKLEKKRIVVGNSHLPPLLFIVIWVNNHLSSSRYCTKKLHFFGINFEHSKWVFTFKFNISWMKHSDRIH